MTGDTKVVGRGAADRLFVNTVGHRPRAGRRGARPRTGRRPATSVILSGPIGLHGVAIMSVREGLEFEVEITSDTQALNGLVAAMLAVEPDIHVLRDPTRGGLSSALNEIAAASRVGMVLDEPALPIPGPGPRRVRVPGPRPAPRRERGQARGDRAGRRPRTRCWPRCARSRRAPRPRSSARSSRITRAWSRSGRSWARERIVDMLVGEQLPRIC